MSRGQLSLELMILVAGMIAFIAILTPSILNFSNKSQQAVLLKGNEAQLDLIAGSLNKAIVLGKGSKVSIEANFLTNCVLDASGVNISLECNGSNTRLTKRIYAEVFFSKKFAKGSYVISISNSENGIELEALSG